MYGLFFVENNERVHGEEYDTVENAERSLEDRHHLIKIPPQSNSDFIVFMSTLTGVIMAIREIGKDLCANCEQYKDKKCLLGYLTYAYSDKADCQFYEAKEENNAM